MIIEDQSLLHLPIVRSQFH